jgi:hypothetical protein
MRFQFLQDEIDFENLIYTFFMNEFKIFKILVQKAFNKL